LKGCNVFKPILKKESLMSEVISKLETTERDELITKLMQFEMQSFYDMPQSEIEGWISHVLLNGYVGFNDMTDKEIEQEYKIISKYRKEFHE
jgi:hypothetical protein